MTKMATNTNNKNNIIIISFFLSFSCRHHLRLLIVYFLQWVAIAGKDVHMGKVNEAVSRLIKLQKICRQDGAKEGTASSSKHFQELFELRQLWLPSWPGAQGILSRARTRLATAFPLTLLKVAGAEKQLSGPVGATLFHDMIVFWREAKETKAGSGNPPSATVLSVIYFPAASISLPPPPSVKASSEPITLINDKLTALEKYLGYIPDPEDPFMRDLYLSRTQVLFPSSRSGSGAVIPSLPIAQSPGVSSPPCLVADVVWEQSKWLRCLEMCIAQHRCFGVRLNVVSQAEELEKIPVIVSSLCEFLHGQKHLRAEGIFRRSVSQHQVEQLRNIFDTKVKERVAVDLAKCNVSPHQCAEVLKLWFRCLPEPVVTRELRDSFLNVMKDSRIPEEESVGGSPGLNLVQTTSSSSETTLTPKHLRASGMAEREHSAPVL